MHVLLHVECEGDGPWEPGDRIVWNMTHPLRSVVVEHDGKCRVYPPTCVPYLMRDLSSSSVSLRRLSPSVLRLAQEALALESQRAPRLSLLRGQMDLDRVG